MKSAKEYAVFAVLALWAVLAPIHTLVYAVLALVFIDLVTGTWASIHEGQSWTSRRLRESVGKTAVYMLCLIATFAMDRILGEGIPLARLCAASLAAIELKSLAENAHRITGIDLLSTVLAKLKPPPKP